MPTCSNSDVCAYLTTMLGVSTTFISDQLVSGSDIRNELDWCWGVLGGPGLNDPLNYPSSGNVHDDLVTLTTRLGAEYSDHLNVFDLLHDILNDTDAIDSATLDIGTAFSKSGGGAVYPTPLAYNIAEDFVNTRTAIAVINTVNTLLQIRFGNGTGTLGNVLEEIAQKFKNATGIDIGIPQQQTLLQQGQAPPIDALTASGNHAIVTGTPVSFPVGTYGMEIHLNVPSGSPGRGSLPEQYRPALATVDYAWNGFWLLNPLSIQVSPALAFPLIPWATEFSINLAAGVTGHVNYLQLV